MSDASFLVLMWVEFVPTLLDNGCHCESDVRKSLAARTLKNTQERNLVKTFSLRHKINLLKEESFLLWEDVKLCSFVTIRSPLHLCLLSVFSLCVTEISCDVLLCHRYDLSCLNENLFWFYWNLIITRYKRYHNEKLCHFKKYCVSS